MSSYVGAICGGSGFHPYECSHDKYCEHCTLAVTDWHNPKECALCDWLPNNHPEKGKLWAMCKEPFAIQIRVWDASHRKTKIPVRTPPIALIEMKQVQLV